MKKRLLSILLVLLMALTLLPLGALAEGDNKCGEYLTWKFKGGTLCNVTRSVSKMTEIERRGGKRWDKPKKAEKSRDCGGGKF